MINFGTKKETYRILYVEDSKFDFHFYRKVISDSLTKTYNIEVVQAKSIQDIETLCEEGEFDIIITDLNLIETNGVETFEHVKGICLDKTPIIVLTGSDDREVRTKCIDAGAEDFFVKGVSDRNIVAKLLTFILEQEKMMKNLKHLKI